MTISTVFFSSSLCSRAGVGQPGLGPGEQVRGVVAEVAGPPVDQRELPLHAERRLGRGVEVDPHPVRRVTQPTATRSPICSTSNHGSGDPSNGGCLSRTAVSTQVAGGHGQVDHVSARVAELDPVLVELVLVVDDHLAGPAPRPRRGPGRPPGRCGRPTPGRWSCRRRSTRRRRARGRSPARPGRPRSRRRAPGRPGRSAVVLARPGRVMTVPRGKPSQSPAASAPR